MTVADVNKNFVEKVGEARKSKSLIFFIGAGVSASQGYSSWNDYVKHLIEYWKYNFNRLESDHPYKTDWIDQLDWLQESSFTNERKVDFIRYLVKKYAKNSTYEKEVLSFEKEYFNKILPSSNQNLILNELTRIPAIYITTNYDSQIENSLKQVLEVEPYVINSTKEFGKHLVNNEIDAPSSTVIHLHGDAHTKPADFISSSTSYSNLYYKGNEINNFYFPKCQFKLEKC
ncbi:SIR2 family protein [Limosilactobacillus sp. Lr3000]|uniref:SIR2 family protein n=1 Tax=Limosilactobacillus albertensis TaxID=2759752 RepID=A0A839H835_9LACO|nr:SIR2 family protein [Limosilactobacillus albertensis]MBB1122827.1 SIR2 family protein [Limosilactobacillus albertensis]